MNAEFRFWNIGNCIPPTRNPQLQKESCGKEIVKGKRISENLLQNLKCRKTEVAEESLREASLYKDSMLNRICGKQICAIELDKYMVEKLDLEVFLGK